MTDCLIIGHNDGNFEDYVGMVRTMGEDSGAWRDLRLAFAEIDGQPLHALNVMTRYAGLTPWGMPYHNTDFLWPTISYLGTYLHRHNLTFDYVNRFQFEKPALQAKLTQGDVRAVAITSTLHVSVHPILEIIAFIRRHNEDVPIIVGGPYISNLPASTDQAGLTQLFEYMDADFYVIESEGEQALVRILQCLRDGGDPAEIPNIAFKRDGEYILTPAVRESNGLEDNMVDYDLFPQEALGRFVTLRTAKSCPFSCAFCGFPQRAGQYRYLSVDHVERELDALHARGVTTLTFIDDTFNVPKKRFRDILQMMIRKDYGFRWNSFYRSDHGDEATIDLMGRAGCEGVFLGVESGSDRMLALMNKTARRADYMKAIPRLRDVGIATHASLIIGFPGETDETIAETWSLLEQAQPDFFRAQLWYCDPVTPIWERRAELDVKGSAFNWSHHTMDATHACAVIDDLFRNVRPSVWLPQNGFEMWSLFYLQRLGMTLGQIKDFLRAFNGVIADGLAHPGRPAADAGKLQDLAARARAHLPAGDAPGTIAPATDAEMELLRG
jgi:anaerobic magnesium-protoporphyrin IX monomethyl ester cyclase